MPAARLLHAQLRPRLAGVCGSIRGGLPEMPHTGLPRGQARCESLERGCRGSVPLSPGNP